MFITALFVIARNWKQPRCPSKEEWIQKMWFICPMAKQGHHELYRKWMELENIIPSEVTQTQKYIHGTYSLISGY
jgi:pyrroloquinoline quinone (PQQ) biosynthesis protein C